MTACDFNQLLIGLQQRSPFIPFTVELQGGDRFEVDRPTVAVRDGIAVFLGPRGAPICFDHDSVKRFVHTG